MMRSGTERIILLMNGAIDCEFVNGVRICWLLDW